MKRIISIFLICIFCFAFFSEVGAYQVGDANRDEKVNAKDSLCILRHAAKIESIRASVRKYCDVNGDEQINAIDAKDILEYSAGIIEGFVTVIVDPTETPEPTPAATIIPTFPPVVSNDGTYYIYQPTIINLNNAAEYSDGIFTFGDPGRTANGVEIVNPFIKEDTSKGVAFSYWITTPVAVTPSDYSYIPVISAFNNKSKEYLKFDFHGSRQYTVPNSSKINDWDVDLTMEAGSTHFMTCVVNESGLGYYMDGEMIPILTKSGSGSIAAQSMLPNVNVRFFIGGTNQIWSAMYSISKHGIPKDTIIKDFTAYNKGFSDSEVKYLYEANTNRK